MTTGCDRLARRGRQHRHSDSAVDHLRDLRVDRRAIGAEAVCGGVAAGPDSDRALYGGAHWHRDVRIRTTRRRKEGVCAQRGKPGRPWQFILLFIVTIGGIYAGIFSPTEAPAVGAFGSIVLGVVGRRLTLRALWRSIETRSLPVACCL